MIAAVELQPEEYAEAAPIWSRGLDRNWINGYDELVHAAHVLLRGVSFLTKHWSEVEGETREGLLRSIEATAHNVTRMLGHEHNESSLLDESLAARVSSL